VGKQPPRHGDGLPAGNPGGAARASATSKARRTRRWKCRARCCATRATPPPCRWPTMRASGWAPRHSTTPTSGSAFSPTPRARPPRRRRASGTRRTRHGPSA
jgi:hypothetical protein